MTLRLTIFLKMLLLLSTICAQDISLMEVPNENEAESAIDITSLSKNIVGELETDREKIAAIYSYVIENISYDKAAYGEENRRINRNNNDVLRRKKAVCWGYAELIREMCEAVDLACLTITGYARDLEAPNRPFENANHAWNAVLLDEDWYLLDATWGSGVASGEDYFMSVYGVDYFLTPPSLFVKNHFPLLPMWQLTSCPLTLEEFYAGSGNSNRSCNFNYKKKIEKFLKLPVLEREAQKLLVAYRINRTRKNRLLLGHAVVDIAIDKKEKGDLFFEKDQKQFAIEQFEAAKRLFEVAKEYCTFYSWQEVAYLFTCINLGQSYYLEYGEDRPRLPYVLSHFETTHSIIANSHIRAAVKQHALALMDEYIIELKQAVEEL